MEHLIGAIIEMFVRLILGLAGLIFRFLFHPVLENILTPFFDAVVGISGWGVKKLFKFMFLIGQKILKLISGRFKSDANTLTSQSSISDKNGRP
jgi:hypothetical protein